MGGGGGTYPIRPGEPFDIVYNITNSTDRAISVNIYQELYSSDNRPVPGSSITIQVLNSYNRGNTRVYPARVTMMQ